MGTPTSDDYPYDQLVGLELHWRFHTTGTQVVVNRVGWPKGDRDVLKRLHLRLKVERDDYLDLPLSTFLLTALPELARALRDVEGRPSDVG